MASDIIPPFNSADNFMPFYWQGHNIEQKRTQFIASTNAVKPIPYRSMPSSCAQTSRPSFLRLDSAGETIVDHSPGITKDFSNSQCQQNIPSFDLKSKRSNGNRVSAESLPKARRTNCFSSQYFQSNRPSPVYFNSRESINPTELDHLASKFSSCSTGETERNGPIRASGCLPSDRNNSTTQNRGVAGHCSGDRIQFQQPSMNPHHPINNNMDRTQFQHFRPPQFCPPPPTCRPQNFMGMPISMLNFRPQLFPHQPPRWGNPQLPFAPQVNFPQWAFNSHAPHMQRDVNSPKANAAHLGVPLGAWPYTGQLNQPGTAIKQSRRQTCSGRKKNSKSTRNNHQTFTKILQRPRANVETDSASSTGNSPCQKTHSNDEMSSTVSGAHSSITPVNGATASKPSLPTVSTKSSLETVDLAAKQRHSSIDFLLGGLKPCHDNTSDSDFLDCEWDTVDDDNSQGKPWAECFMDDDPYNPLTGWRCIKRPPLDNLGGEVLSTTEESTGRSSDRQDFDSGTESGSEGNSSEEDLDDITDRQSPPEQPAVLPSPVEQVTNSTSDSQVDGGVRHPHQEPRSASKDSLPYRSELKAGSQQQLGESQQGSEDATRRQKCLHPSISYVLGGYEDQHSHDDGSESDDWDDFSDSDDETYSAGGFASEFTPQLNRDNLGLFQIANGQFPKKALCPSDAQGQVDPEDGVAKVAPTCQKVTSPSAPCGPIFKPKARTVLITQRIIRQVSDRPVSMVVPLEASGRMSQNLMPTIQVGACLPSPRLLSATIISCMTRMGKSRSTCKPRTRKQVHFSNKATLVVCPEPSDVIDEIRQTRRGPWLDFARDRCRFQHRITHLERVISPCLSQQHRERVAQRLEQQNCHIPSSIYV